MTDLEHMRKNLKFKTTILTSSIWDYSDVYILLEGRITVVWQGADAVSIAADRNDKEIVFKNYAPFINCISKINNVEAWRSWYCEANV